MKPEEFSLDSMPMLPEVASYVLKIALEDDVSVARLAGLIEKDQTLTARILCVANSSYYKRSRTIYTVRDAAVVLGLDAIKTLALGLCVLDIFPQSSDSAFDYAGFWRHCLGCAVYARNMMSATNESLASKAFSAALLHDIGKVVINQTQPKRYEKLLDLAKDGTKPLIEFEQETLGTTHAEVGRQILEHWELPKIYTEIAWCHHAPVKVIDDDQYLIAGIVHIANILSHMTLIGSSGNYFPHKITNPLLRRFSLSSDMLDELMVSVPKEIDFICNEIGIGKQTQGLFTLINRASTRLSEVSMALHQKTVAADLAKRRSDILMRLLREMNSSIKISDVLEKSATVLFDAELIRKFIGGVKIKKQNLVYEAKRSEAARFIKVGDEEIRSMILSGDYPVGMSLSSGVFVYVDPKDGEFSADEDFIRTLIDAISSALRKIYSESAHSEEKKLLRQALEHASEEKMKAENLLDLTRELVDASTVALCLLDDKGMIAIENKVSHDIRFRLNMTRDNILASLEDGQGEYHRRLKAAILSRVEDDILWRDHEAVFHIKVHPVNFNNWLLIIIWDTTKELENQRRMLAYAKMSAVGNLASSMAHNMKSPLGALHGFTSIIKGDLESGIIRVLRGDKQDEDFQDIITNMGTAVENVLSIVDQLLNLSRKWESPARATDLGEFIESIFQVVASQADNAHVALKKELGSKEAKIKVQAIEQVLISLVMNAILASSSGGEVLLKTFREERKIVFSVIDEGIGMDEKQKHKIFEPFYTAWPSKTGMGLGLAFANDIVNSIGGSIEVNSELGKGTTFTVSIHEDNGQA